MTNYAIPTYNWLRYSYQQLVDAVNKAGFQSSVVDIMVAIAYAESGGTNAIQKAQPYSTTGWGTWQITPGNSVPTVGVDLALLDLDTNAEAAFAKYRMQGLRAWSTYNSGIYKKFLGYRGAGTAMASGTVTTHPMTVSKSLQIGNTGALVTELQRVLRAWYPFLNLSVDGVFGNATAKAVGVFQARSGETVTGVATNDVLTKLGII